MQQPMQGVGQTAAKGCLLQCMHTAAAAGQQRASRHDCCSHMRKRRLIIAHCGLQAIRLAIPWYVNPYVLLKHAAPCHAHLRDFSAKGKDSARLIASESMASSDPLE